MSNRDAALEALHRHFGFSGFREGQDEVIDAVLGGEDALVVMPTGGGKSLCYQLPALMRDGTTVVVSPLIALMKDQVDALDAREIPATFINSSLDFEEQTSRLRAMRRGGYKLVYVAPERFKNDRFVESLAEIDVSLFAVDEAHCISEWGHDFRPDYRRLSAAAKRIGRPQIVALTATATPEVRADIAAQLELGDARHFIAGFDRPNLALRVAHTSKEREKLLRAVEIIHDAEGSGIVYAATRKAVETVASSLRDQGLKVRAYHAGLDDRARNAAQDAFMSGELDAIVATNAFGMGIDKRDIRFVLHYHLPGSIEAYYQEIGRAGRDGLPATCTLLFNFADTRFQQFFIDGSFPSPEFITDVYHAVVALGPGKHEVSARDLAQRAGLRNDMAVGSALSILERAGHIERGGGDQYASIEFLEASGEGDGPKGGAAAEKVLAVLTGSRAPRPGAIRQTNLNGLASAAGLSTAQARRALEQLDQRGVLRYKPAYQERGISLLDDAPARALRVDRNELARRAAAEQRKLRRVVDFAYHQGCLRAYILKYFGDRKSASDCGTCSGCVGDAPPRRGRAAREESDGTMRVRRNADLDGFILDSAPTGDALREHLKASSRDRARQREREVLTDPDAIEERRAEAAPLGDEGTLVVRKVLACVARARERFGKSVIAGVLRGSKAKNVVEPGLDRLSTYGILSELTQDELVAWCDALVGSGLLSQKPGAYPTLQLTARGTAVMKGEEPARVDLRRYRLSEPSAIPPKSESAPRKRAETAEPTVDVTFALFKSGMSIDEIAEKRSLAPVTVEAHIAELIESGRVPDISGLVPDDQRLAIEKAATEHGLDRLKPIREALGTAVRYREIRFVVADIKRRSNGTGSDSDRLVPDR